MGSYPTKKICHNLEIYFCKSGQRPTLNYRLDCTAMKLFSQNQLDFFIWNDFAVVYHGDEASPEAWVNMHGRWGRISIESLDHECRWLPRDEFLARFGNLPPLPVEAFKPLRLLVA